jgi:hypothetical protein
MSANGAGRMSRALGAINSTRDEIMDQLTKDGAFVGGPSNWPECKIDPDDAESCPLSRVSSGAWQTVVPGNETRCLNGDEFTFHVRKGDEDKLIIYFAGGGACWTGTDNKLREFCEDSKFVSDGIFSDHEDNPFANYTIVQVRYCSGDAFVGDRVVESDPSLEQRGYRNVLSVIDWAGSAGLKTRQLSSFIISGSSAGSIGAQMWASALLGMFKYDRAVVLADSYAGVFPEGSQPHVFKQYNVCDKSLLNKTLQTACEIGTISLEAVFKEAIRSNPSVTFVSILSKNDVVQKAFYDLIIGSFDDVHDSIIFYDKFYGAMNEILESYIEVSSQNHKSFLVQGTQHTYLDVNYLYSTTAAGIVGLFPKGPKLTTWIADVLPAESDAMSVCYDDCDCNVACD